MRKWLFWMNSDDKKYNKKVISEVIDQMWFNGLLRQEEYKEFIHNIELINEEFELP